VRQLLLTVLLLICAETIQAQAYRTAWITDTLADEGSHVWFRHCFSWQQRPTKAMLSVAADGMANVYVNGMNVSRDLISVTAQGHSAFDVADYLRPGRNIVAIWTAKADARPRIAVELWGVDAIGNPFDVGSDDTWLCRTAPATSSNDHESFNAADHDKQWHGESTPLALWRGATRCDGTNTSESRTSRLAYVLTPAFFDTEGDSTIYDFGTSFHGMVRVTLRGAKKGERINIGSLTYTCSGETDEQAFTRFATGDIRRLIVCGDPNFHRSQIQSVEGLAIR